MADPEIAKHFARVTFLSDNRADLPKIQTRSLILQCSEDIIAPQVVGEYMRRVMPNSTLRHIENIGHCPHLSAPAAIADAINAFLPHQ
jgi:sigma-B regulation protein RsbQ